MTTSARPTDSVDSASDESGTLHGDFLVDAAAACVAGAARVVDGEVFLSSRVRRWLEVQRATLPEVGCRLGPRPVRAWGAAVVAEAQSLKQVEALLASSDAASSVLRLRRVRDALMTLRSLEVPRDLLTSARAGEFTEAWRKADDALHRYRNATGAVPPQRMTQSAGRLDLDREIRALRDGGGFFPWDHKISDGALRRVRPHFHAAWQQRSRHDLANDLELLRDAGQAETHLVAVERQVKPILTSYYSRSSPSAGKVSVALFQIWEHLQTRSASDADLDAVWSMRPDVAANGSTWDALIALADARQARKRTYAERFFPGMRAFPASCLLALHAAAHGQWVDALVLDAALLNLLAVDENRRLEGQQLAGAGATRMKDGAARIAQVLRDVQASRPRGQDLSAALEGAVADSKTVYAVLDEELRALLEALEPLGRAGRSWQENVGTVLQSLEQRRAHLETFRLVLFGRTGAGKSSFAEALSAGRGRTVSTGESDFTTVAQEVRWGPCTVVDTPGIEGWGRGMPTDVLEREARRAVDAADLVILMFDTQNQKQGEFDKVARWVLAYDKPLLPMLNVRNGLWRRPEKEPDPQARRAVQASVAEHAQHIQDSLSAHGLYDQHPVAVNMFNAVAARCEQYAGPHAELVEALRAQHGSERLLDFSNFGSVADLLNEIVSSGALQLRLQSLANDLRQRLVDLAQGLFSDAESGRGAILRVEEGIEQTLALIGPGAASDKGDVDRQWRRGSVMPLPSGSDQLTDLERLRGDIFTTRRLYGKVWDAFDDHWARCVSTTLTAQAAAVEDAVRDAFATGKQLSSADVSALYHRAGRALAASACEALTAVRGDLEESLEALALDLGQHDLEAVETGGEGIDARRGSGQRTAARALTVVSTAVIFVPVPGVNLLVAAGVRAVGQLLLSLLGKRSRDAGERDRAAELAQGLRSARDALLELERDLALQARRQVRDWATEIARAVRPEVEAALTARRASDGASAAGMALLNFVQMLPQQGAGTEALRTAKDHVASGAATGAAARSWRSLARGDDWIEADGDVHIQVTAQEPNPPPRTLVEPYVELERFFRQLPVPDAKSLEAWLGSLADLLPAGASEPAALRPGARVRCVGPARVGISRARAAVEANRSEAGDPLLLEQLASPAGEDAVLLLVPPSLFGSGDDLSAYLGAPSIQRDTLRRIAVVLTRIDELVGDPDESPDILAAAVERKIAEVHLLLRRAGWPVSVPVVPLAGAPYGRTPPQGHWPWWSGAARLASALEDGFREGADAAGRLRSGLTAAEQASDELSRLLAQEVGPALEELERVRANLVDAARRGERLQVSLGATLTRQLERIVMPLAYDLAGAATKAELVSAQQALSGWRSLPAVEDVFMRFEQETVPEAMDWLSVVGRELGHSSWRRETWSGKDRSDGPGGDYEAAAMGVRTVLSSTTRLLRQLGQHKQYYRLGKDLGHNFRPWEAVKGSQRIRNVTPALGGLTVVLSAVELWHAERGEKLRNALRSDAPRTARDDVVQLVAAYLAGDAERPGLGVAISEALEQVATEAERVETEHTSVATAHDETTERRGLLLRSVDEGHRMLFPDEEAHDGS